MSNPSCAIYGLIGYPLGHSLSPVMHNTAFGELGVEARYQLFPMPQEEIAGFLKGVKEEGSPIFGLNVTVPHKEAVLPFLDSVDPFAEKVGAVNTIVVTPKRKLVGYNTDGPGFLTHLTEIGVDPVGKRVAIVGAGGAARAIVSVLCLLRPAPESILIYDIDQDKARQLLRDLSLRMETAHVKVVSTMDDLNVELADLLVNATPVGMRPGDPLPVDPALFHPHMTVYDLIYNPAETKLLKAAREKGAHAVNGLKMLFYQGVLAFQHWAETQVPEPVKARMWEELEKACYKK
ncbi:MAG: shikimate dehydrogenase [Elusimicrobia bacterium]|nr:shikimate dehydrogenase [Elusimicrobiota bacterium]